MSIAIVLMSLAGLPAAAGAPASFQTPATNGQVPAAPTAGATKKRLTIADLWAIRRVGNPVFSPDGSRAAYTVSAYDAVTDKSNADIVVRELATGEERKLTTDVASDTAPCWSPDGGSIAFVSKREGDKVAQLYRIELSGGEARRLTRVPFAVSSPRFTPDGRKILFVTTVLYGFESPEALALELETREKKGVEPRVTEDRMYRHWDAWFTGGEQLRLFSLDLQSGKLTDVLFGWRGLFDLDNETTTISYDISPDGKNVVFSANSVAPPYRTENQDLFLAGLEGGMRLNLTTDNPADDEDPVFSPDGKTIAFGRKTRAEGFPDRVRIALLDLATRRTTVLTEPWDVSPTDWRFTADGRSLVFRAEVRARTGIYSMPVAPLSAGARPTELVRGGLVSGFALAPKGDVLFTMSTLSAPPEVFATTLAGGEPKPLSKVNDEFLAGFELGAIEEFTFPGANDEPVQMFVCYPPGFDKAKKWPLVHLIHGGPISTFGDGFSFRWNTQAFAACGAVIAMVNFHGSSSFGQAWVESILGAHADKPFTDVMKATDFLIARGFVDEHRLAAAGGSYGGYLVNWIAGHTDRFAALVSHAGVYSLHGQMASDGTEGRRWSYGGFPFTNLENFEKWSPNRYSANFTTPMLVLHGERDFRVPVTQGLELYGVLQAKGVAARLVVFPDENHWVLRGKNSIAWYTEVFRWLGRFLPKGR